MDRQGLFSLAFAFAIRKGQYRYWPVVVLVLVLQLMMGALDDSLAFRIYMVLIVAVPLSVALRAKNNPKPDAP